MTQPYQQGSAAAGWYPDYADPSRLRYFDGTQWTEHTHPGYGPQPGGYGTPPGGYGYGSPGPWPAAQPENTPAIVGFILAIVGLVAIPILASIPGLILGIIGLSKANNEGASNRGLAIAAIWISAITLVIWTILIIAIVAAAASAEDDIYDSASLLAVGLVLSRPAALAAGSRMRTVFRRGARVGDRP